MKGKESKQKGKEEGEGKGREGEVREKRREETSPSIQSTRLHLNTRLQQIRNVGNLN